MSQPIATRDVDFDELALVYAAMLFGHHHGPWHITALATSLLAVLVACRGGWGPGGC